MKDTKQEPDARDLEEAPSVDVALEVAAAICDAAADGDTHDDPSFAAATQARELAAQIRALKGGKWRGVRWR